MNNSLSVDEWLATGAIVLGAVYVLPVIPPNHIFGQVVGYLLLVSGSVSTLRSLKDWIGVGDLIGPLAMVLCGLVALTHLPV